MARRGFLSATRGAVLAALVVVAGTGHAVAQTTAGPGTSPSAILTIDPERLFEGTAFGQRALREIEARAQDLAAENRRIEAELIAEEGELTELRPTLEIDEFRALADAFNEKVDRIRQEQDAKELEFQRLQDIERQRFFGQIGQILSAILRERNAAMVLDRRNVFISIESADITQVAIDRINAEIGDGSRAAPPGPEPETGNDQGTEND